MRKAPPEGRQGRHLWRTGSGDPVCMPTRWGGREAVVRAKPPRTSQGEEQGQDTSNPRGQGPRKRGLPCAAQRAQAAARSRNRWPAGPKGGPIAVVSRSEREIRRHAGPRKAQCPALSRLPRIRSHRRHGPKLAATGHKRRPQGPKKIHIATLPPREARARRTRPQKPPPR